MAQAFDAGCLQPRQDGCGYSGWRHHRLPGGDDEILEAELGLQDFVVTSWQAVMAPAGVPAPILARLEAACIESLRHPESTQRLNQIGFDVVASSAAEFRRFQEGEITRWRAVAEGANIRPE